MTARSWAGVALTAINATAFVAASVNLGVWSLAWWAIVIPFSFVGWYGGRLFAHGLRKNPRT